MKINNIVNEFAPANNPSGGNYLKALASAWYNDTYNTGDLNKGIKSQEDVERILARGIHCGDGKVRKYMIGYNHRFDGVDIQSDDHYEYSDYDDAGREIDSRTGKPWGPYDVVAFGGNELDESISEARAASAAFRSGNARRSELNAMTPEERKAHEEKRAEQQRKRDDARLARERAKNVAEAAMTPDQIAAARAAAPYGYNPQTGKPNPAPDTAARVAAAPYGYNGQTGKPNPAPVAAPAQPAAAPVVDQAAFDRQAAKFGLPPGSTKEQLVAAIQSKSFSKAPAAPAPAAQAQPAKPAAAQPAPTKGAVGQAAIAADAAGQNADAAALAAMQKKNPKLAAMMAQAGMNADGTDIAEGSDERKRNAMWAQITSYENRAKETKNDIKRDHLMKMASELRAKLPTTDEQKLDETFNDLAEAMGEHEFKSANGPVSVTTEPGRTVVKRKEWDNSGSGSDSDNGTLNAPALGGTRKSDYDSGDYSDERSMDEAEQQKGADYRDPPEADYGDDYQAMVKRMKQLAGAGPLKTVYDPTKRVYKNVPTATQPGAKK